MNQDYLNWKKEFEQLLKEYNSFKGTKKERSAKFQDRIDKLWNDNLQRVIKEINIITSQPSNRDVEKL